MATIGREDDSIATEFEWYAEWYAVNLGATFAIPDPELVRTDSRKPLAVGGTAIKATG